MIPQEIMIGDYFFHNGRVHKVLGIKIDNDSNYRAKINNKIKYWILVSELEPIPLTP